MNGEDRKVPTINVGKILKWLGIGVVGIFAISFVMSAFYSVNEGEMVVYQNPLTRTVEGHTDLGTRWAMPFASKITRYQRAAAIVFSNKDGEQASLVLPPVKAVFPDNYSAAISAVARFRLSTVPADLIAMNSEFQSYDAVVVNLLAKRVQEAMKAAALQYTSEDFFMRAGMGQYRNVVTDYVTHGIPEFQRKQVETRVAALNQEGAPVVKGQESSKQRQFRVVYIPILDEQGNIVRTKNTLAEYNIEVVDIVITDAQPDGDLVSRLGEIRNIFDARKVITANQENERQAIITAQLKGEREREEAGQRETLAKEVAETQASREAAVQVIDAKRDRQVAAETKSKELEQAQADRDIQLAAAQAAVAEAKAIRARGLAHAAVEKATWNARDNDMYRATIQADMMKIVSENFKDANITMPQIVMGGGQNGTSTNSAEVFMDLLSAAAAKQLQSGDSTSVSSR